MAALWTRHRGTWIVAFRIECRRSTVDVVKSDILEVIMVSHKLAETYSNVRYANNKFLRQIIFEVTDHIVFTLTNRSPFNFYNRLHTYKESSFCLFFSVYSQRRSSQLLIESLLQGTNKYSVRIKHLIYQKISSQV